ncbi:MAG: sigma factor-like helix-turn-helix DNA-binding protein [Nakamurella sp.]
MTFEEFLANSFEPLARYARLLSDSRDDADDLLAESLLVAHRKWHRIGAMEFPAAYVRRIISTRRLRTKGTWFNRNVDIVDPSELTGRVVDDELVRWFDRDELTCWLTELPVRQRTAVVLRYFSGLGYDQIAAELSVSPTGARTLVSRGIAALRVAGSAQRAAAEALVAER